MDNDNETAILPSDKPLGTLYQLRLRSLLCQRFAFRAHAEKRRMPAYRLVVRDTGLALNQCTTPGSSQEEHGHSITMTGATMQRIATALSSLLQAPVIDNTNQPGRYDLTLECSADKDQSSDDIGEIRAELKDLGLELAREKAPLDVLVVDSIARPSAN